MKLACSVVLYQPDEDAIKRIDELAALFNPVIVLDNSSKAVSSLLEVKNPAIVYLPFYENKGIAYALNKALEVSKEQDCDFLLTLDQDSTYPYASHSVVLEELGKLDLSKDAILALATKNDAKKHQGKESFAYVHDAITSGNFLNLALLKEKNIRFDDDLFIDYVDFDLDAKINLAGLRIKQLYTLSFDHTIGNPLVRHFFFIKFYCMNHSPLRYYYRFRNAYYLYHQNKKYYRHLYFHTMLIDKWKMYLYEPNKKEKRAMIKKGIKDGKQGKLGRFN